MRLLNLIMLLTLGEISMGLLMGLLMGGISATELELILEQEKRDMERDMLHKVRDLCEIVVKRKDKERKDGDSI